MNDSFNAIYGKMMPDYFDNSFGELQNGFELKFALEREIEFFVREMSEIPKMALLRSDAMYFLITT